MNHDDWRYVVTRSAAIVGRFTTLNRERVVFEGSWDERDGAPWDLCIEGALSPG
jgi:hypothetical protein